MSDTSQELHQASILRNNLLFRAVGIIKSLQHDTNNLVSATELEHDSPSHLMSASAFRKVKAVQSSAPAPISTPVIKIPIRFKKSPAASTATGHAYQQIMHDAAEQRNLLLKRAYDVVSNLQSDVDGLVEEVAITAAVSPDTPSSPPKPGQAKLSGDDLTDIMRTAAATSAAAARLRAKAEQAQRQAQEAEGAQQHAAEEEAKAARLAQQAEQRARQEQGKGNLPAAVAASSTAARLRKAASSAQAHLRQLKARANLKGREAQDSFALANAAEQKAQALEAAGLARAGAFSPLPHSPVSCSPQSLPTPAMLRGLAGGSRSGGKGWLGRPDEATSQHRLSIDFGAAQGSIMDGPARSRPGDQLGRAVALEGVQAQAMLLQATCALQQPNSGPTAAVQQTSTDKYPSMHLAPLAAQSAAHNAGPRGRLQAATEAAQHSEQQQASAVAAGQQAQQAAAQVAHTHKAANKAKAEAGKLAAQASRLREVGQLEEAKKAQIQAKRSQQAVVQAEQAVAAAEQVEKEAAAAAQAAAAASFAAEAKAEELTGVVKQLQLCTQEATEAGALAMCWKKKAHGAAQKALEVREAADEYTAQASAAGQRATAAEQEAQQLEAQGKFADAAAAALQADRWQKAAGDASKQAVKLQAEAKAAAAQSDAAQEAAMQAKHLATCLNMTTGHLQAAPSTAQGSSALQSAHSRPQTPTLSQTEAQSKGTLTPPPQPALQPRLSAPMPKGKAPRATVTASPSRLSRMTLQDTQASEEEESVLEQDRASPAVQRAASVQSGPSDATGSDHPRQKPELQLQLHLPSNADLSHGSLSRAESAAAVHSPRKMSQEVRERGSDKDDSTEDVVPPWRSNSAAAWVKQRSFQRSLSATAFPDGDQHEEEQQPWEQQAEPNQDQAVGPQAGAGQSGPVPGRARPLGNLHIETEEHPQQDGLQEWTEPGLDDIAAAVAQYTGASPDDLLTTEGSQHMEEHSPEQLPQQQQQRPQAARLQLAGLRSATQSPRDGAKRQYATQQEQMEAELEAAMAADAGPAAEPQHINAQWRMGTELQAATAPGVPKYANAQEQMEAELEAAMAAETGVAKYSNAQEQMEAEMEAAMAAETHGPKYANAQEQMEAELEAAMAADAAAAADETQDVRHGGEEDEHHPHQWQQKNAEVDAKTMSAAPHAPLLPYPSSAAQAGQRLDLAGVRDGLDLAAGGGGGAQFLPNARQKAEASDMAVHEEAAQKWQRAAHKAQRHADACFAEANAKDEEAAEAAAQAAAAQQEAEELVNGGRHTDAEAATAAAQRWVRRAAKAQEDGDAARAEGDAKVEEARDAIAQAAQVQQSMHQQGQAPDSPLQQPLNLQSASRSPKQPSHQAEEYSFGVSDADQAEQGSIAVLLQEAAAAMHQAELAQLEAQQLQGAGHFAEAAALSSSAHKWRKKAAKANRVVEQARAEGIASPRDTPSSPREGRFDTASPREGHLGTSSPQAQPHAVPEWLMSPRATPTEASGPLFQAGLLGHAGSISPGSLHRQSVFSHPGTRPVSSEGSAEAAATQAEEDGQGALRQELGHAQQQMDDVAPNQASRQEASGYGHLLDEVAQWAKRNTKALKLARRATEAAAASEREAAAAAEEAERARRQAEHAESEGLEDEQTQALRRAASKWTKRAGKAQRAAARARTEAEAQQAQAAQAAQLAEQAAEAHAQAQAQAQAEAAAQAAAAAAEIAAEEVAAAAETAAKARQQADSTQAEAGWAAGKAAAAWAEVEAMESRGDAAGAAASAAEAVALQQQVAQRQAAAEAATSQAQQQERTAATLLTAASTAAKLAGVTPKLLQQLSNTAQLELSDANSPRPSVMDTVTRMSSLSEQLPWQLQQQQPAEQQPDSTGEHASADAATAEAGLGVCIPSLTAAPASKVGSFAQQLQQQEQELGVFRLTGTSNVLGSSSMVDSVGQGWKGDEETAARAAYRQWSESFEAGRVANKAQEKSSLHQEAEQEAAWPLPHQEAEQEAAGSASPHQALGQEDVYCPAPPHSVAPAVVSWESFKSLAKPGDRLRLVGDSTLPYGDTSTGQTTSFGVVTPAGSGLPLVTTADVAEWVTAVSPAGQRTGDDAELAGTGNLPAWDDLRIGDPAVGDDQMQWGHRLEAARSQGEKLLVFAEEREQRALSHTQRALELQHLAASSDGSLGFSQLSAAAQRCTAQAEEAAQLASLARAEAARLAGPGPAPVPPSTAASLTGAPASNDTSVLTSASLPIAEEAAVATAAAEGAVQLRLSAGPDASADEQTQLSRISIEVIRGLSTDMEAAMQQLVASAHSSSSTAALPGAESGNPAEDPSWDMGTGYGPSQGLPHIHSSTLAASSFHQLRHLPDQASWQIPMVGTKPLSGLAVAAGVPALPEQATGEGWEGQGPSGMQIHLMHQLDGLERSIRQVEQQVRSTKQTRRRFKTASLPAQGDDDMIAKIPYLDGLPMEYWVVPPRTPIVVPPSLSASLSSLHRTGRVPSTASRTAPMQSGPSLYRHALLASRSLSFAPTGAKYRQHTSSRLRTRLPMSAYATPQHARQSLTHPKENWQEDLAAAKSPVQLHRDHPAHPLQDSN